MYFTDSLSFNYFVTFRTSSMYWVVLPKLLRSLLKVCIVRERAEIQSDDRSSCNARDRGFQIHGDDGPRDAYDLHDVYDRVPRDAHVPHGDDDARDDHDDAYGHGRVYDLLYGDDCAYGTDDDDAYSFHGESDDDPRDGPLCDHAHVCGYACDDGLHDDDAYDLRDGCVYVRVCGGDLHGDDAYVPLCAHDRVHGDGDVSQFPYDCDDDDAR